MATDIRQWAATTHYAGRDNPGEPIDDRTMFRTLACMKGGSATKYARYYFAKYMLLKKERAKEGEGPSPREVAAQASQTADARTQVIKAAALRLLQKTTELEDLPEWQELMKLV